MNQLASFAWQRPVVDQVNAIFRGGPGVTNAWPTGLLLSGAPGSGKLAFMRQLAIQLLCQNNNACGHCKSCLLMDAGHHPDSLEVLPDAPNKPLKIEAIRSLKTSIELTPQIAQQRLVLLGPLEQCSEGAANALLKSLEEPPNATHFMLFTHQLARVKTTLLSRCRLLQMPKPTLTELSRWLESVGYDVVDSNELSLLNDLYVGAPLAVKQAIDARTVETLRAWSRFLGDVGKMPIHDALVEIRSWADDAQYGATILFEWTQLWLRGLVKNKLRKGAGLKQDASGLTAFFALFDWVVQQQALLAEVPQMNQQRLLEQLVIHWHQTFGSSR